MTRPAAAIGLSSPPGGRSAAAGEDVLSAPGRAVHRLREMLPQFSVALDEVGVALDHAREAHLRSEELGHRLRLVEAEREHLLERLRDSEDQVGRLMTLYVASYQLHASLDPTEVHATIVDVVLNLLGAQSFLVLLRVAETQHLDIAVAHGIDDNALPSSTGGRYAGGDPLVDTVLQSGSVRFGPVPGSRALAAVPLRVQDMIVGALVIFRLLPHKAAFHAEDTDLFDLIGAHAASALFAARTYAGTARKLRTLEDMLTLVKRG